MNKVHRLYKLRGKVYTQYMTKVWRERERERKRERERERERTIFDITHMFSNTISST